MGLAWRDVTFLFLAKVLSIMVKEVHFCNTAVS